MDDIVHYDILYQSTYDAMQRVVPRYNFGASCSVMELNVTQDKLVWHNTIWQYDLCCLFLLHLGGWRNSVDAVLVEKSILIKPYLPLLRMSLNRGPWVFLLGAICKACWYRGAANDLRRNQDKSTTTNNYNHVSWTHLMYITLSTFKLVQPSSFQMVRVYRVSAWASAYMMRQLCDDCTTSPNSREMQDLSREADRKDGIRVPFACLRAPPVPCDQCPTHTRRVPEVVSSGGGFHFHCFYSCYRKRSSVRFLEKCLIRSPPL